jgi:putative sigma-54 modulation protein
MKIDIQAPFQVFEHTQQLIEEKLNKMAAFYDHILGAKVFLRDDVNPFLHKPNRVVEIQLEVPGITLFAEASDETFEKAISSAAEKVKKQVLKHKEINEK